MTGRVSAALLVAALMVTGCSTDGGPRASGEPTGSSSRSAEPDREAGSDGQSEDSAQAVGKRAGEQGGGPGRVQTAVLAQLDGSNRGRCVDVAGGRDVRSGGFAAGPFDEARVAYRDAPGDARTVRLYFIPEHPGSMPGVTVTGRLVHGNNTFREVQRGSSTAEQFHFYDVDVTVPVAGRWQIRADAGPDSGCWSVRLG